MKQMILTVLVSVLAASAAQAVPHITVKSSEVVQADPLRVKTTFDVDLVGPGSWCWIELVQAGAWPPSAGDTTQIYACSPPSGWDCSGPVDHRVIYSEVGDPFQCFGEGAHFSGFTVTTNKMAPCFHIIFATPLLGLDGSYHIDGCLAADGPVPAQTLTWGALKSVYR